MTSDAGAPLEFVQVYVGNFKYDYTDKFGYYSVKNAPTGSQQVWFHGPDRRVQLGVLQQRHQLQQRHPRRGGRRPARGRHQRQPDPEAGRPVQDGRDHRLGQGQPWVRRSSALRSSPRAPRPTRRT
ncbi:hypothetical protein [Nocardioides sp. B-3]|uniref:hypothetical protein n=1 Tax=Nocardioides sp. B-3 TaxID=2895565 RepID=UPI00215311A7|nr:hypothetical protein [Nocardioides sp. B-3]UUZ57625.1 hypothetical protein LP418_14275 [Nocardioides sp. B-3]